MDRELVDEVVWPRKGDARPLKYGNRDKTEVQLFQPWLACLLPLLGDDFYNEASLVDW